MAINATNNSTPREVIPAGSYPARCYQMIHIGTIKETYEGQIKIQNKIRIGWELPTETREYPKGILPMVISREFTLSLHEKAGLRGFLKNWRSKDFTEDEAKMFDVTKLLGVPCMLNIVHTVKDGNTYANIGSVSPMPKGFQCPPQVNANIELNYDQFDHAIFDALPDFIKEKMRTSVEYSAMQVVSQGAPVASQEVPVSEEDETETPF